MRRRVSSYKNYTVRHEVARVFIRDDPVFCHRYPTGPCVGGNPGVRSAWDNVASAEWAGDGPAKEGRDCQPHGGREPGLEDMVKVSEPLMSRRYFCMPKRLIGMDQKVRSQDGEPVYLPTQMSRCRRKGGTYVLREWYTCGTW